jgi:hypothetical protein
VPIPTLLLVLLLGLLLVLLLGLLLGLLLLGVVWVVVVGVRGWTFFTPHWTLRIPRDLLRESVFQHSEECAGPL